MAKKEKNSVKVCNFQNNLTNVSHNTHTIYHTLQHIKQEHCFLNALYLASWFGKYLDSNVPQFQTTAMVFLLGREV